jgi:hypothetical protein
MQQQFRLRRFLCLRRATEFRIHARRKFHLRRQLFLRVRHERPHVAPRRIASDRLPPPRPVVQNNIAPCRERNVRQFFQRQTPALRVADEQIANGFRLLPRYRL